MSRYIDLDSEDCVWCGNPGEYENWNVPLDMPGEDVAPVVHGHWEYNEELDMFQCSKCGLLAVRNDYPYCHWCGSKMDEVTGNG